MSKKTRDRKVPLWEPDLNGGGAEPGQPTSLAYESRFYQNSKKSRHKRIRSTSWKRPQRFWKKKNDDDYAWLSWEWINSKVRLRRHKKHIICRGVEALQASKSASCVELEHLYYFWLLVVTSMFCCCRRLIFLSFWSRLSFMTLYLLASAFLFAKKWL